MRSGPEAQVFLGFRLTVLALPNPIEHENVAQPPSAVLLKKAVRRAHPTVIACADLYSWLKAEG
jgi:hypothetical protein